LPLVLLLVLTPPLRGDGYEEVAKPADGVIFKLHLDRTMVALSGRLRLTLTAKGPAALEIDPIASVVTSNEWAARPGGVVAQTRGGQRDWSQTFDLEPFPLDKDKKVPLAVAPVRYRIGSGDWLEQKWKPIDITVTTSVVVANVDDAKGITGIETL